jgi:hypothetical protein
MTIIKNYFSKIFHNDSSEAFSIIVYIDFDSALDPELVKSDMNEIVEKNHILKQSITEENGCLLFNTCNNFKIEEHYTIKYIKSKKFNDYICKLSNEKFNMKVKWKFLLCIDKKSKKSRFYFKIHHAYADGYKLMNILFSKFNDIDNSNKLKRKTNFLDTIYYYFIGTIILIILNIKILVNYFYKKKHSNDTNDTNSSSNDYVILKKIKFQEVKDYTTKYNITINDFLYFLMVKTDKMYRGYEKELNTISLVNISGIKETNNVCPVINKINNSKSSNFLKTSIHNFFNNLKYSLFIPLLHYILNKISEYICTDSLSSIYNNFINDTDYVFSNVIGSNLKSVSSYPIKSINFLTIPKNNEVMYNIISFGDYINIVCSFKKSGFIQDKKKFKDCFYKTYSEIINEKI